MAGFFLPSLPAQRTVISRAGSGRRRSAGSDITELRRYLRLTNRFARRAPSTIARQSPAQKIFVFSEVGIGCMVAPVPFRSEGRVANGTKREAECECRGCVARRGDV